MSERVMLVTGATDGIGRETARQLVVAGHAVIAHGRDAGRLAAVHAELEALGGRPQPEPVAADLSSLEAVRALANRVLAAHPGLAVLVNNAGIFATERRESRDGFELTMAVNHDAPFLLTHLLLERLGPSGRVVNVSSVAHKRGQLDLADLDARSNFEGYRAYAASKLANVLFTVELARRLGTGGPTVNALHPGVVSTKLLKAGFGMDGPDSLAAGAATSVYLATSREVEGKTGGYYARSQPAATHEAARDAALCAAFYRASCTRVDVAGLPG